MNCSPRGAGYGITAVQTDSFQVRLEPRSLRVHEIICSSKDVKELWGIAGNGVHVCCYGCGWCTRHFPVSTCFLHQWSKKEFGLGILGRLLHLFFLIYLHLRGKGPYIQSAHKTGVRRKAVPEMCFFLRMENSWATISIFIKECSTELEAGKRTMSWMKTYHIHFKVGDFWIRKGEGSRGSYFSSPYPQFFCNKGPHPKVSLLRICATWSTQRRTRVPACAV